MSRARRLSEEEVVDTFIDHSDVISAMRSWARGHLSDNELIERLTYLQRFIDSNEVELEEEGLDGPWEAA